MKKQATKVQRKEEEMLCCCEYVNRHGERSHVAACCCDCEDLDDACERWEMAIHKHLYNNKTMEKLIIDQYNQSPNPNLLFIIWNHDWCFHYVKGIPLSKLCARFVKREPQRAESLSKVAEVIKDRVRVPWLWGGAQKLDLSIIPPLILLPALLHLAALHFLLGLLVLTALPGLVLWYYYFTHYKKGRTLFFLSLALFSLGYMYYLFITEVLPGGNLSLVQVSMVTVGVIFTLVALVHTKQEPGVVLLSQKPVHYTVRCDSSMADRDTGSDGARQDATMATSSRTETLEQAGVEPEESGRRNWCTACRVVRPPRAGHCRICGVCVLRLDHHCVWWVLSKCLSLLLPFCHISNILSFLICLHFTSLNLKNNHFSLRINVLQ